MTAQLSPSPTYTHARMHTHTHAHACTRTHTQKHMILVWHLPHSIDFVSVCLTYNPSTLTPTHTHTHKHTHTHTPVSHISCWWQIQYAGWMCNIDQVSLCVSLSPWPHTPRSPLMTLSSSTRVIYLSDFVLPYHLAPASLFFIPSIILFSSIEVMTRVPALVLLILSSKTYVASLPFYKTFRSYEQYSNEVICPESTFSRFNISCYYLIVYLSRWSLIPSLLLSAKSEDLSLWLCVLSH